MASPIASATPSVALWDKIEKAPERMETTSVSDTPEKILDGLIMTLRAMQSHPDDPESRALAAKQVGQIADLMARYDKSCSEYRESIMKGLGDGLSDTHTIWFIIWKIETVKKLFQGIEKGESGKQDIAVALSEDGSLIALVPSWYRDDPVFMMDIAKTVKDDNLVQILSQASDRLKSDQYFIQAIANLHDPILVNLARKGYVFSEEQKHTMTASIRESSNKDYLYHIDDTETIGRMIDQDPMQVFQLVHASDIVMARSIVYSLTKRLTSMGHDERLAVIRQIPQHFSTGREGDFLIDADLVVFFLGQGLPEILDRVPKWNTEFGPSQAEAIKEATLSLFERDENTSFACLGELMRENKTFLVKLAKRMKNKAVFRVLDLSIVIWDDDIFIRELGDAGVDVSPIANARTIRDDLKNPNTVQESDIEKIVREPKIARCITHPAVAKRVLLQNADAIRYLPSRILYDTTVNQELGRIALKDGVGAKMENFQYLSSDLKQNGVFVRWSIDHVSPWILQYTYKMRDDTNETQKREYENIVRLALRRLSEWPRIPNEEFNRFVDQIGLSGRSMQFCSDLIAINPRIRDSERFRAYLTSVYHSLGGDMIVDGGHRDLPEVQRAWEMLRLYRQKDLQAQVETLRMGGGIDESSIVYQIRTAASQPWLGRRLADILQKEENAQKIARCLDESSTADALDHNIPNLLSELGIDQHPEDVKKFIDELLRLKKEQVETQRKQTAEESVREMKTILPPDEQQRLFDRDFLAKYPWQKLFVLSGDGKAQSTNIELIKKMAATHPRKQGESEEAHLIRVSTLVRAEVAMGLRQAGIGDKNIEPLLEKLQIETLVGHNHSIEHIERTEKVTQTEKGLDLYLAHARGEITEDQYERASTQIIQEQKGATGTQTTGTQTTGTQTAQTVSGSTTLSQLSGTYTAMPSGTTVAALVGDQTYIIRKNPDDTVDLSLKQDRDDGPALSIPSVPVGDDPRRSIEGAMSNIYYLQTMGLGWLGNNLDTVVTIMNQKPWARQIDIRQPFMSDDKTLLLRTVASLARRDVLRDDAHILLAPTADLGGREEAFRRVADRVGGDMLDLFRGMAVPWHEDITLVNRDGTLDMDSFCRAIEKV